MREHPQVEGSVGGRGENNAFLKVAGGKYLQETERKPSRMNRTQESAASLQKEPRIFRRLR
jgi:molybdenum-dependent DNA-binding transcriptional regulator ModE